MGREHLPSVVPILAFAASGLAHAQAWPTKPVRIVVPFAVGGITDLLARVLAQALSQSTGQTFVVENKTGAGGAIGSAEVARAAPDGYTLLVTTLSTHAVAPHLTKLPYNTVTDFTPIAHLADSDLFVLASPNLGVKNMAELIELARSKPGYLNYTSSGVGTIAHLSFELFECPDRRRHESHSLQGYGIGDCGLEQRRRAAVARWCRHGNSARERRSSARARGHRTAAFGASPGHADDRRNGAGVLGRELVRPVRAARDEPRAHASVSTTKSPR